MRSGRIPDYTYLDNLGDTTALLEVMGVSLEAVPECHYWPVSSDDLPRGHTSGNLGRAGRPGSASDISNRVCQEMMDAVESRVTYSSDCERMTVGVNGGRPLELSATIAGIWRERGPA